MSNIVVPELGESVVEARVTRWLKKVGDAVVLGEPVVELETEKVDLEVSADTNGVLASIARQEGEDVNIGELLAVIDENADPHPPATEPTTKAKPDSPAIPVAMPALRSAAPAVSTDRSEDRVRMSKRRHTIARRLVEAQRTAAMLTTFNEADMTAIMALRARRKVAFKEEFGVGLGITSFFVKSAVAALRAFPVLNAEIQGDDIVYKHYYDVGVAVGAEGGLVVPVIRNADRQSFVQIEQSIHDFATRATDGTLTLEDLRGGTFTITNGGVFGSLLSTPILNPPQVGILGLHKIQDRAMAVNGQVVIRPMMYVALSYDHRIVDGREAVQFLARLKDYVEDPGHLLLEG